MEFPGSGVSVGELVVSWLFFWWFGKFHTSCRASWHPCSLISTRSNGRGIPSFSWVLDAQVFCECSQGLFLESTSFHMFLPGLLQVVIPHFLIGLSTHFLWRNWGSSWGYPGFLFSPLDLCLEWFLRCSPFWSSLCIVLQVFCFLRLPSVYYVLVVLHIPRLCQGLCPLHFYPGGYPPTHSRRNAGPHLWMSHSNMKVHLPLCFCSLPCILFHN